MSRSDPPRSSIAAKARQSSPPPGTPVHLHPSRGRKLRIRLAHWMRWLHIYLSMFSFAAILFFSATGITLNHPRWFSEAAERHSDAEGQVSPQWLHLAGTGEEPDPSRQVDKLEVVEHLRKQHRVHGALAEFRVDEAECMVTFKGPGYAADAFIDRETGRYRLTETYHGFVALVNDLHKGRDSGPGWSVLIDVSAGLMVLVSLTGLVLLFYLKLRRGPGLIVAALGTAVVVGVFLLFVP